MTDIEARLILTLEACLDAIERDGVSLDAVLARYPEEREALEPLLIAALRVQQSAEAVQPSMAFQRDSVRRLKAKLPPRRAMQHGRWWRTVASAAAVAVIATAGGGAGLAYAADPAVPGDALYSVDQSIEQVQLLVANQNRAVTLQATFLDERLSEVEQLAEVGDIPHLDEALSNYDRAAQALAEALTQSGISDGDVLDQVNTALSTHEMRLQEVLQKVPEQGQQGILRAIEASQNGRAHAQHALDNHGKPDDTPGNGPPENPGSNGQGQGKGKDKDDPSNSDDDSDTDSDVNDHPGQGQGQGQGNGQGNGPPDDKPGNGGQADD